MSYRTETKKLADNGVVSKALSIFGFITVAATNRRWSSSVVA